MDMDVDTRRVLAMMRRSRTNTTGRGLHPSPTPTDSFTIAASKLSAVNLLNTDYPVKDA